MYFTVDPPFGTIADRLPEFAWPGGYPIVYFDKQGNTICPECARKAEEEYRLGVLGEFCSWAAGEEEYTGDWGREEYRPAHGDVYWEGDPLQCDECFRPIESAYGPVVEDAS